MKDLKNDNRYTQLSAKLESDLNKPGRWLVGECLCGRLPCPNGELNALGPPTQNPNPNPKKNISIREPLLKPGVSVRIS